MKEYFELFLGDVFPDKIEDLIQIKKFNYQSYKKLLS